MTRQALDSGRALTDRAFAAFEKRPQHPQRQTHVAGPSFVLKILRRRAGRMSECCWERGDNVDTEIIRRVDFLNRNDRIIIIRSIIRIGSTEILGHKINNLVLVALIAMYYIPPCC